MLQGFPPGIRRALPTIHPPLPRYFALHELRDLFMVTTEGLAVSQTQTQLHNLHSNQRSHGPSLQRHLEWLRSVDGFAGVSDHDLLFSRQADHEGGRATAADEGRNILKELEGELIESSLVKILQHPVTRMYLHYLWCINNPLSRLHLEQDRMLMRLEP